MAHSLPLANVVLVVTAAVLFYVAVTDLKHYKIRNELMLALIALFFIHTLLSGRWLNAAWGLGLAAFVLIFLLYFYSRHWMGGGDVKMIGAVALYLSLHLPAYYQTDIGERRVVALPDGSRISMDSDTRVRVAYQKTARSITLDRGRSRFDVAHDSSRPFTVTAGPRTVVAVGTSFDVERLRSTVLITLIQGQVVIKGAEPELMTAPISLNAGEQLVVSRDMKPNIVAADPQVARAWEAGRLLFRDEPLGDAVARVNRYTTHAIQIDPSIASIRISGVFNAGDIGSFVSAVTSYFAVQASTTPDNSILLQPRS